MSLCFAYMDQHTKILLQNQDPARVPGIGDSKKSLLVCWEPENIFLGKLICKFLLDVSTLNFIRKWESLQLVNLLPD